MLLRMISIALVFAFMFKPIFGLIMVVDYELNRDYFTEYLCSNKTRPELKCQGKCFLMQKLERNLKETADHKAEQLTQLSKIEVLDVSKVVSIQFLNSEFVKLSSLSDVYRNNPHLMDVFHPPTHSLYLI